MKHCPHRGASLVFGRNEDCGLRCLLPWLENGIPNQDIAIWVTMDPIADRARDRLGASDLAIVELRRQMVQAVRDFQAGQPAIVTGGEQVPAHTCALEAIMAKMVDWRSVEARPARAAA